MKIHGLRRLIRYLHILAAFILGAYLYSPLADDPDFRFATLYVVFPLMGLTGFVMWQWGKIARLIPRE